MVPFEAGIDSQLLTRLSKTVQKLNPLDRCCSLIFDEISLTEQCTYDKFNDKVIGYIDLGPLGRKNQQANHALTFMLNGLHKKWKQPVAYFFTRDTISTHQLKNTIKTLILKLEQIGLNILCTVCDQGATNRSAINLLCKEESRPGPYFTINDHKVFTIFDPPHLLKKYQECSSKI